MILGTRDSTAHSSRTLLLLRMGLVAFLVIFLAEIGGVSTSAASSGWSASSYFSAPGGFDSISCLSSTFCAATGIKGQAVTYNGTSWSGVIFNNLNLGSVSCGSTSFCLVDSYATKVIYNGTSWTGYVDVNANYTASCLSSTYCIGISGNAWGIFSNGSWALQTNSNHQTQIIDTGNLQNISCASVSFCAADDTLGNTVIYDGSAWETPVNLSSNRAIYPYWISCAPNTTFCVAVEANGFTGYSWTFSGGTWGPTTTVTNAPFDSVSCATSTFCMGVTSNGKSLIYNGSSWGEPIVADPGLGGSGDVGDFGPVSCPTTSFCAAVDSAGHTFIYNASLASTSTTTIPQTTSTTPARYVAKIDSMTPTSSSMLSMKISVTNVGGSAGSPSCFIKEAGSRTRLTYTHSVDLGNLSPHKTDNETFSLHISQPVARLLTVSVSSITCH